ncbi:MAG TPA: hypothetical protein PLA50_06835, partial [Bacteroidia bacterium]|nr:hypothetical protein [Bacteroidia bacterium]
MIDTCRSSLFCALILAAVSLPFTYDPGGMRSSTIWVAGGPRFNSSTGSRYMSGNTYHQARPGWQTNGLLLGIIPISAVLASFAAPSTSRRRQRTIAGTIAFLLLAGTFLTKGDGYGGTGFW